VFPFEDFSCDAETALQFAAVITFCRLIKVKQIVWFSFNSFRPIVGAQAQWQSTRHAKSQNFQKKFENKKLKVEVLNKMTMLISSDGAK
jgi:hypothetical protein